MNSFSTRYRRIRRVRTRIRPRGQSMQRQDGQLDTDNLARQMSRSPDRRGRGLSQVIQARLTVGAPDDAYEKEADRTADAVVNAAHDRAPSSLVQTQRDDRGAQPGPWLQRAEEEEAQTKQLLQRQEEEEAVQPKQRLQRQQEEEEAQTRPLIQRQEEEAAQPKRLLQRQQEEEEEVQTRPLLQRQEEEEETAQTRTARFGSARAPATAPTGVAAHTASRIAARRGSGSPMAGSTQHFMQAHFQRDFSGVRIHNDAEAHQISQQLNAQAFTLGRDIYFNSGRYNPNSREGQHLLAHELTHVVQQNSGLKKKRENEITHTRAREMAARRHSF